MEINLKYFLKLVMGPITMKKYQNMLSNLENVIKHSTQITSKTHL